MAVKEIKMTIFGHTTDYCRRWSFLVRFDFSRKCDKIKISTPIISYEKLFSFKNILRHR